MKAPLDKLKALLALVNPFGIIKGDQYVKYDSEKDAYLDVMITMKLFFPRGYVDVPLFMNFFQGIEIQRGVMMCGAKGELWHLDFTDNDTSPDKWRDLLQLLLKVTGIEFKNNVFVAAYIEFMRYGISLQIRKGDFNNLEKTEEYYETDCKESVDC